MTFISKEDIEKRGGIIDETSDPRIFQTKWANLSIGPGKKCYYVFGGSEREDMFGVPFETLGAEATEAEEKLAFAKAQASADYYESEGHYPR